MVKSCDGLLIGLSLHGAVSHSIVTEAVYGLLELTKQGEVGRELLRLVEAEVWRLEEDGVVFRSLPELLVACSDSEGAWIWRCGANGVAIGRHDGVMMASEDLRYAALRRRGVDLSRLSRIHYEGHELAEEVSALTQNSPEEAVKQELRVNRPDVAMLMTRGSLPFGPPAQFVSVEEWWAMDCGWNHGLPSELIVIADSERSETANHIVDGYLGQ